MKLWMRPEAKVQQFLPNEYVAMCCDVNTTRNVYWFNDTDGDGQYNFAIDGEVHSFNPENNGCGCASGNSNLEKFTVVSDANYYLSKESKVPVESSVVYRWIDNDNKAHISTGGGAS